MSAEIAHQYLFTIAATTYNERSAVVQRLESISKNFTLEQQFNIIKGVLEAICEKKNLKMEIEDFEDKAEAEQFYLKRLKKNSTLIGKELRCYQRWVLK